MAGSTDRTAVLQKLQTAHAAAVGNKRKSKELLNQDNDFINDETGTSPGPVKRARASAATAKKPSALRKLIDHATPLQRWHKDFDADRRKQESLNRSQGKGKVVKVVTKVVKVEKKSMQQAFGGLAFGFDLKAGQKVAQKPVGGLKNWLADVAEKKKEEQVKTEAAEALMALKADMSNEKEVKIGAAEALMALMTGMPREEVEVAPLVVQEGVTKAEHHEDDEEKTAATIALPPKTPTNSTKLETKTAAETTYKTTPAPMHSRS